MIKINGQVISNLGSCSTVIMNNDGIIIDGKRVELDDVVGNEKKITIVVADCTINSLNCRDVEVHGSKIQELECHNCKIEGNIEGDVDGHNVTVNGSVGGNIECNVANVGGNVHGKVKANIFNN